MDKYKKYFWRLFKIWLFANIIAYLWYVVRDSMAGSGPNFGMIIIVGYPIVFALSLIPILIINKLHAYRFGTYFLPLYYIGLIALLVIAW